MLVVADTSPLVALVTIGYVDVLPRLYGSVVIPTEVAAELASGKRAPAIQTFISTPPGWLSVRSPSGVEDIPDLDSGELAAISLARELNADVLLIDENRGREAAIALGIRTARTAAVLLDAARAGVLVDLKDAFDKLRTTNFRVPPAVLDELLRQHEREQAERGRQRRQ